jgi:hypothetical protein
LSTTQCSMRSAEGGGNWLRIGAGVGATGCFFAAQPARSKQNRNAAFFMPSVFARRRALVDGNLGYLGDSDIFRWLLQIGFHVQVVGQEGPGVGEFVD